MDELNLIEAVREIEEENVFGPAAKDEHSTNSKKLARRTEQNLTPAMKLRRDRFVRSYVIDFIGTKAAVRIGIPIASAPKQASELLREPYVQQRLQEYILEVDESVLVSRNTVLAGLVREANSTGLNSNHSARVQAWKALGKILGMEIDNINVNATLNGGVMIVPMASSEDEWEQQAMSTQEQLKHEVEN